MGFIAYPAHRHTLGTPVTRSPMGFPEVWMGVYDRIWMAVASPVSPPSRWTCRTEEGPLCTLTLPHPFRPSPGWLRFVAYGEDRDAYMEKIALIQQHLRRGDLYQANYTIPTRWALQGDAWGVFWNLLRSQPTAFAAYIQVDAHRAVLSFSPELFFHWKDRHVFTLPMKGTRPRGQTPEEDRRLRDDLARSEKDRAENVMIVDLLRNDLGKIALPGGVQTPVLFAVESYPTVHQMVSRVEALLPEHVSPADLLIALFPGGSITGAPKKKAVEILHRLEPWTRGVYTGAIGVIFPWREAVMSIAIRTLQVMGSEALYGVGGGVVLDSSPRGEWEELQAKMAFLLRATPP